MAKLLKSQAMAMIMVCLAALQAGAYDFEQDGIYYSISNGAATVQNNGSFNTYSGDVVIPATVTHDGTAYPVRSVGYQAFRGSTGLTGVTIPEGVNYIMGYAFYGCSSLTNVTLPGTMYTIYTNAFVGCSSLEWVMSRRVTPPSLSSEAFTSDQYESVKLYAPWSVWDAYKEHSVWGQFTNNTWCYDFEVDGVYYAKMAANEAIVTYNRTFNNNSYSGSVTVPQTVAYGGVTYRVTGIGNSAFRGCTGLTQVSLPATLDSIGYGAFYSCTALTRVVMPGSVARLGDFAFGECSALTAVTLPASLTRIGVSAFVDCTALQSVTLQTGADLTIGINAFRECSKLTTVTLSDRTTLIDQMAFYQCTALNHVNVPASVKEVGYGAFAECTALDDLQLNEGLETIGHLAFYYTSLDQVEIPASVTTVEGNPFAYCFSLTRVDVAQGNANFLSDDGVLLAADGGVATTLITYPCAREGKHYTVPLTVSALANYAFAVSDRLKSVYIPGCVKTISDYCFFYSSVKRLVMDEGVEQIGYRAFFECDELQSVYLPSTITSIGDNAFYSAWGTSGLTEFACAGATPSNINTGGLSLCNSATTLYVPAGAVSAYQAATGWKDCGSIVAISDLAIGTAFTVDSINYTTLDAAMNVKVSGPTAKTIYDPGFSPKVAHQGNLCAVTQIGGNSMQYCTAMPKVEVPFTTTLIDGYAFYGCSNLQELRLNEGLERMGTFSLSHIDAMTSLSIPASVDSIVGTFVTYSGALKEILVNNDNTKYASQDGVLFSKDKKLLVAYPGGHGDSYTVPTGTQAIGTNSFRGAAALQSLTMPTTLRVIESSAFMNCTSLEDITVPTGVETIENHAFFGCTNLANASLPSTLTSLGYLSFGSAAKLARLEVEATTPPTCRTYFNTRTGEFYTPFIDSHYSTVALVVPTGSKTAYQAANVWKQFLNISEQDFPADFKRGDVNGDGNVNIADVTALIDYLLGGDASAINPGGADATQDGNINIADVTALIDHLLGATW